MGAARAVVVAVLLIAMMGLIVYSIAEFQYRLSRLLGREEAPPAAYGGMREQAITTSIMVAAIAVPSLAVAAVILAIIRGRRLLGVIRFRDLQRHVLIFGPTGSGKTSTAFKAIELALKNGVPVVIMDWKGEYAQKIRGATVVRKIRLLEPPDRARVQIHAMIVTDILRDVLQLTEPMSFMLYEELSKMYEAGEAGFKALLQQLRARRAMALAQRMGAEANIAEGLIRRLLPLILDEGRRAVNLRGDERITIYDLSELPTYQLKTLYAEIILWRLYNEALSGRSYALRKIIVAEEAQNYVRPRRLEQQPSIGERVVNELRAYGYGFILIAPDPLQLPLHMPRDAGAVISIGYQALPEVVADLLSVYRYMDMKRLMRATSRPRTYIYYDGRLHITGVPKPYTKIIDLGAEAAPEIEEPEESEKVEMSGKPLRFEEEPGPIGGAHHQGEKEGGGGGPMRLPRGLSPLRRAGPATWRPP